MRVRVNKCAKSRLVSLGERKTAHRDINITSGLPSVYGFLPGCYSASPSSHPASPLEAYQNNKRLLRRLVRDPWLVITGRCTNNGSILWYDTLSEHCLKQKTSDQWTTILIREPDGRILPSKQSSFCAWSSEMEDNTGVGTSRRHSQRSIRHENSTQLL